ncbi:ParB/RepB/Spo0J family partition protein [Christensenellaceae bacterium OttesenSCG-928-L17]|nr:ParB/RepB/Spo0J family partition protein [Christensenellaceae bacterium OttesenSCG-928-L17]
MAVFDFLKDKREVAVVSGAQEAHAPETDERQLHYLPIDEIIPNPNQPRKSFDDEGLEELAESIAQVGLIQPLVVRRTENGIYELVAGERRLRACRLLALQEVACIVEESMTSRESAMVALIENLQRENLHYLEEAESYAQLIATYGLTQEELAEQLGRSQSSIANKLRVLRLPDVVKNAMTNARMTERHARALLRLKEEEAQLKVIEQVREKGLSVKETERLVEKTCSRQSDEKKDGAAAKPKILRYLRDYRLFTNSVNTAAGQLREAGFVVDVAQTDLPDGVDMLIRVRRAEDDTQ